MSAFDPDVLEMARARFGGYFGPRKNSGEERYATELRTKRSYAGTPEDIVARMDKGKTYEEACREAGVDSDTLVKGEYIDTLGPFQFTRDKYMNWVVSVTAGGPVPNCLQGSWLTLVKVKRATQDYLDEQERTKPAPKESSTEQRADATDPLPAVKGGRPRETDRVVALATLERMGHDVALAAAILGINERTLRRFVEEDDTNRERSKAR